MKMSKEKNSLLKDEKGQATLETIPLLLIFVIFVGYGLGAFGVIHTGILHNIAARTYALETFHHRANLTWFRQNRSVDRTHYALLGYRLHAIGHESDTTDAYGIATERPMSFGFGDNQEFGRNETTHNNLVLDIISGERQQRASVNPVWIRVQYGICINASCGRRQGPGT